MLTYYINTYRKGTRSDARPLCFFGGEMWIGNALQLHDSQYFVCCAEVLLHVFA